jgi:K+-transporting ATPase KdpF subunit
LAFETGSSRQEPVNVLAPGIRISSGSDPGCSSASSVRFVLADQDSRATYGGPMTVVAGIIALLLLGYLIVALLNPERF